MIGYDEHGSADGRPIFYLHGVPVRGSTFSCSEESHLPRGSGSASSLRIGLGARTQGHAMSHRCSAADPVRASWSGGSTHSACRPKPVEAPADSDAAVRSLQAEGRHALHTFDSLRRVFASATAP